MNTLRIVVAIGLVAIPGVTANGLAQEPAYPIQTQAGQKHEGGTTVDAFAKVSKQRDKGLVEVSLWVRKSGQFGIGYGGTQIVLLDKDGNTIYKSDWLMGSVGAVFGKGTHEKWFPGPGRENTRDFTVPLQTLKDVRAVALLTAIRDTGALNNDELNNAVNGIVDTARNEFVKKVKDAIRGGSEEDKKALSKNAMLFMKIMAAK